MPASASASVLVRTRSAASTARLVPALRAAVWALMLLSVVPWRRDVLFDGGIDAVVVGKGVVALVALVAAAVLLRLRGAAGPRLPLPPVVLVGAIVAVSLIGAALSGDLRAAAVQAVRLVMLAATVLLLLCGAPPAESVRVLLGVFAGYAAFAAVSGAIALAWEPARTRLQGGFPAFEPNELAALLLPVALALVTAVAERPRFATVVALAAAAGTILWTGSRTSLALLVAGAIALVVLRRRRVRLPRRVLVAVGAGLVVLVAVLVASGLLSDVLLRGEGIGRLLTLNSRTFAWQEVFATPPGSPAWWLGRGLDVKDTVVHGHAWHRQVFDSSWVSALAQTGVVGLLLTAAYAAGAVVGTARRLHAEPLWFVLALAVVLRGVFENGVIESSATFVLLFVIACLRWPARVRRQHAAVPAGSARHRADGTVRTG